MSVDLVPGGIIADRYRLDRLLGQGGMGAVWAATHTITRREVALKFLKGPATARAELRRRLLREARAASAVRHPNVVDVLDVFELDDATPVMVMDLLRGETFGCKLARESPLSVEATARVVAPVVSAVGTAHALGIVHRDLKPDNIFLAEEGGGPAVVKVLDFGIAKLLSIDGAPADTGDITGTSSMLGTPYYMAPEQAGGEKDIDARVDVWAIGVILYESLSGRRPVEGNGVAQIVKQILTATIPPIRDLAPGIPDDLAALVGDLLSRDRAQRPQDLRGTLSVLRRCADVTVRDFGPAVSPSAQSSASELGDTGERIVVQKDASPSAQTERLPHTPLPHAISISSSQGSMGAPSLGGRATRRRVALVAAAAGLSACAVVWFVTRARVGQVVSASAERHEVTSEAAAKIAGTGSPGPAEVATTVAVAVAATGVPQAGPSRVVIAEPKPRLTAPALPGPTRTAEHDRVTAPTNGSVAPSPTQAPPPPDTAHAAKGQGGLVDEPPF
jgi:serine/threonine-protein kinase